ncbi:MAG: HAMP domain-containing histidine kinase [Anaerolineae bacterium]|nr:HAMP domain-containing histidine kinase [Anaerolineae bacterium]NUQ02588.1 hypothetical protein [Anaerolineae bacterium]
MGEIITWIESQPVDLLIVAATKRGIQFAERLREWLKTPPLLVMITSDSQSCQNCRSADLVFALHDPHLIDNLVRIRQIRQRAAPYDSIRETSQPPGSGGAEILKDMIVKTVSHELRTPLLQVKSAVSLLADGDQDRDRLIGYAMESTARLEGVVQNIARLAESLDIRLDEMHPGEIMQYAMRHLRRSWEWRGKLSRIDVQVAPDLPTVLADRRALGVAVHLLLDNALKFSSGRVTAQVRLVEPQTIEVRISDSGIGIASEKLEHIFEPFYQIDSAAARRFGGAGVGLAIVRFIMDRHRIPIQVESKVGVGSAFSFKLAVMPVGALPP